MYQCKREHEPSDVAQHTVTSESDESISVQQSSLLEAQQHDRRRRTVVLQDACEVARALS